MMIGEERGDDRVRFITVDGGKDFIKCHLL